MKEFIMGLAVGMAGGAVLVANSCKLRKMIKKNQEEFMQKAEKYIDDQLEKAAPSSQGEPRPEKGQEAKKGA